MPAVVTQQLAEIADLALTGPPGAAISMLSADVKNAQLRKASGKVLAAYGKRMHRGAGGSFRLATWGDLTKGLVVDLATFDLFATSRGFNPETPDGKSIREARDSAENLLNEIADITNKNARIDPDAVGEIDVDEEGPLAASEGGPLDQSDAWTQKPSAYLPGRDIRSPGNGIDGGGFS